MLDPRPARTDFTDRELTRIIGGLLGSLAGMTELETLRRAVKWWTETDEAWEAIERQEKIGRALGLSPKK